MTLQLDSLRKSLHTLSRVVAASSDEERMAQLGEAVRVGIRAGVVRHFGIVYDVCWKLMARWLNANAGPGVAIGATRRQLFRLAAEHQLIEDVGMWMSHHAGRMATNQIYDPDTAEAVYQATLDFVPDARALLRALEARSD